MNSFNKQWIGSGLIILMLVKAWLIPLICLDYQVRKDYIAKTLCVNRNRPKLNCNGKCYLAKKLAAAQKQEQRQAEQDYLASVLYQVMSPVNDFHFGPEAATYVSPDIVKYRYQSFFHGRLLEDSIFHPPLV